MHVDMGRLTGWLAVVWLAAVAGGAPAVETTSTVLDVVIVGAGLAGAAAAQVLNEFPEVMVVTWLGCMQKRLLLTLSFTFIHPVIVPRPPSSYYMPILDLLCGVGSEQPHWRPHQVH